MSTSTILWLTAPFTPKEIMAVLILDFIGLLLYIYITEDEDSFREMYGYYFFISVFLAVAMTEHQIYVNGDFNVEHTSIATWTMSGAFCYVLFLLFTWTVKSIIRIYFVELDRERNHDGQDSPRPLSFIPPLDSSRRNNHSAGGKEPDPNIEFE